MNTRLLALVVITTAALSACSNNPDKGEPSGALKNLPQWAISPVSDTGLADSACVSYSGHLNIDRSEAITLANEQLAGQLSRKVAVLAKSFQSKTQTTGGINVGTNFTQAGQQLVQQELKGAKATQMGVFEVANQEQLCVLVELDEGKVKSLYSDLKNSSKANLTAEDDSVIFEEFRAYKASQDLERALQADPAQ